MGRVFAAIAAAAIVTASPAMASDECGAAPWLSRARLENQTAEAGQDYLQALSADYFLRLVPTSHGWQIKIADGIDQDLSVLTPPIDDPVNPRFIEGWHFRNTANTGQNEGDVNAPQLVRVLIFSPDAPALYRQYGRAIPPEAMEEVMRFGRATLTIKSFDLADTEPGARARMTRMTFDLCAEWMGTPLTPTELGESSGENQGAPPHIVQAMMQCALPSAYQIQPYIQPPYYEPDFNGDAIVETAALAVRTADGKRGIAVCWSQPATRLDLIGFDEPMDQLVPEYFDHMTDWMLQTERNPGQGMEQGAPPVLSGDSLLLAKEESSSVLLYWDDARQRFWSYWQGD